jgi:hypothetical protein
LTAFQLPLSPPLSAERLAHRKTTFLTLGHKKTPSLDIAQNPIPDHGLSETPEQAFRRFTLP